MRRTVTSAALLLVTSLSAASCAGGGDGDDPDAPTTGASDSADAEPTQEPEPTQAQEQEPEEPDADSEVTPPGTVLEVDEPAVVVLPDNVEPEVDRAKFSVTLDAVTEQPFSKLPPGRSADGASTLLFVEQTYTLLDELRPSIVGASLLEHTGLVTTDDQPIQPFVDIAANPRGCDFARFSDVDAVGDTKTSCLGFLVYPDQEVEAVTYVDYEGDYNIIDGDPVRWELEEGLLE